MVRLDHSERKSVEGKDQNLQQRWAPGTLVHVTDRAAQLVCQDHQHQRGRDQLHDGARGRQHPGGIAHVVAIANHDRQGDHGHRNHLASHSAGDGPQNEADDDDGVTQTAAHRAKQLTHGIKHVLRQTAFFKNGAHEGEKGNGQQQVIAQNAEDIER